MGNLCPWCKSADDSESTDNPRDNSALTGSQRSVNSAEVNDRTPLLSKTSNHNQYHQPISPSLPDAPATVEPSSVLTTIVPPPPPPIINSNYTESTIGKLGPNEAAESTMATIVERMLPDLIDVGGWGTVPPPVNTHPPAFNAQNDQLKQILNKSLQSTRILALPDSGTTNLSSLLSNRPISSETCHFVAQAANELSRLLIDEIKIVHKEDLVVTFE